MSKALDRIADAGGILFLLLVGVGYAAFVAPFSPPSLTSPTEVIEFLEAHPVTWQFHVGIAVEFVGLLILVAFAIRMAGRIRMLAGSDSWLPAAVVGLALLSAAVKVTSFGPGLVARLHTERYDASTVTALFDLNEAAYDLSWALDGLFVLMLGVAALTVGGIPRWLAAWAVVAGAAVEVGIGVPSLFESLQPVFLLWLLVASGWAVRNGVRNRAETRPAGSSGGQTVGPAPRSR